MNNWLETEINGGGNQIWTKGEEKHMKENRNYGGEEMQNMEHAGEKKSS